MTKALKEMGLSGKLFDNAGQILFTIFLELRPEILGHSDP